MEVVQKKSGNGVRWVVVGTKNDAVTHKGNGAPGQNRHFWQNQPEVGHPGDDSASLGMTIDEEWFEVAENQKFHPVPPENVGTRMGRPDSGACIFAVVDPQEKWWARLRGNPKRSGEISQAAFLLKAETLGFDVALPWGDNQKFDFVVWRGNGRAVRVQVKATGRLHRWGYEIQPVHATRHAGKKRYSKKDIDVIAAHVQPLDAWYLIPIERVGRAKSLRLYPGIQKRSSAGVGAHGRRRPRRWERWRDRWDLLEAFPAADLS